MTASASGRRSMWLKVGVKCLFSAALLALVMAANRQAFADTIAHRPRVPVFLFALCCYLTGVVLALLRWWLLVRAQSLPFRLLDAFRLGWIGMFFNLVIPGAIGGDVIKAAYLAQEHHHKGRAIASIIVDRLVAMLGLFLLASAFGLMGWRGLDGRARPIVVASMVAMCLCASALVLAFSVHPHGPLSRRLAGRPRWERLLGDLHAMGVAYRKSLPWVAVGVLMAMTTHFLNVVAFAGVIQAIRSSADGPTLLETFSLVPLVLFSTAIPLPFSGLGAAENVSAILFLSVGYRGGAVAMLGFRLFQLVAAVIGAWVYLLARSRRTLPVQFEPERRLFSRSARNPSEPLHQR
jgi:uncharacterized membrane protein YbhN (UPF0104 family)